MGQQQLLLVVLSLILISIAIYIGIELFQANAIEQKRLGLISECSDLARIAHQYYLKPAQMGGGGNSFLNWQIPVDLRSTTNGNFEIESISNNQIVIIGVGTEVVTGSDSIKVQVNIPAPPDVFETIILK